ncbi:hypothetical protein FA15DRAFT_731608 [Coprinopsis marcescibilis]|uniref:non-specific serine/threonine protein kinase n=1 Tax=Coprinopsis marcescibilis TaxID=230819 RepID=A0A5C3KE33_COPMA|nr:hypothetical protein FA15DRAFT_731608 [Coprinopsis marcescibilis]
MSSITLNCLVSGDGPGKIFTIDIAPNETVFALKASIKAELPRYTGTAAKDIQLFKVSLPLDEVPKAREPLAVEGSEELGLPLAKISTVFKDPLLDDRPCHRGEANRLESANTVSLNCLMFGDTFEKMLTIEIAPSKNVNVLKDLIKQKRNCLAHIDVTDMQLFKPKNPLPVDDDLDRLPALKIDEQEKLSPARKISAIFEDIRDSEIHVFVHAPTGLKRAASPSLLQYDLLKRAKLIDLAPSQIAKPAQYKSLQQNPSQKILDDRPSPDVDVAPIALLYHGFGHFEDIITCREAINIEQCRSSVDAFAEAMSCFYPTENDRRDAALPHLNGIFSAHVGATIPSVHPAFIGTAGSDGHSVGRHGQPLNVIEIKNEQAGIQALPQIEAAAYVGRLHNSMMPAARVLLEQWRMPCLGITIIGHEVRFYAIILLGHQYRVVSLTPALSCLRSASSGWEREVLYAAFAAACALQVFMLGDIEHHLHTPPPPIPRKTYSLPAVSKLKKHGVPGEYIEFQIAGYHPSRQDYRQLYFAHTSENPDSKALILVKFSRTYCIDLHAFRFSKGHAPRILGFEYLPGGWYGIAMEYLQDVVALENAQFERQLMELIEEFHGEGFVHGDLRNVNILCADEQFWLIDFDWGGKDGEVVYPTSNLNPELMAGRIIGDLKIRREDDIRILRNTLDRFKS